MTVRVKNMTPGLICLVPPSVVDGRDPVAEILGSVDVGKKTTPEDALRVLVGLEVAKRQEAEAARRVSESAFRRAKETVDLYPVYQGEKEPERINEVGDDTWRALEKVPAVAARIAKGELRVVGQSSAHAPW